MTAADGVLVVIVGGLTAYTVLAGADFGGGVWDLLARGRDGAAQRRLVSASLGPVWEANHVWLVFVVVATFSGFPPAFGAVSTTLQLPLAVALLGIVLRGSAYVYRAYGGGAAGPAEWWGRVFAAASTVTPFMLGVSAAALASGSLRTDRPLEPLTSPFGLVSGALAVAVSAFLAAVYLCGDAARERSSAHLVDGFRRRALGGAVVAGGLALALLPLLWRDAPRVADRFAARGLPFVALSAACGVAALVLVWRRRFAVARVAAGTAAAAIVWGWAAAQYPDLVIGPPGVAQDAAGAAAPAANVRALLVVLVAGLAALAPALVALFRVFARPEPDPVPPGQLG